MTDDEELSWISLIFAAELSWTWEDDPTATRQLIQSVCDAVGEDREVHPDAVKLVCRLLSDAMTGPSAEFARRMRTLRSKPGHPRRETERLHRQKAALVVSNLVADKTARSRKEAYSAVANAICQSAEAVRKMDEEFRAKIDRLRVAHASGRADFGVINGEFTPPSKLFTLSLADLTPLREQTTDTP